MKRYQLTRSEAGRKLSNDPGALAEEIAAAEYSGYNQFVDSDFFDMAKEDVDSVAEVKSTATTLSGGQSGRFRLWKEQHDKLVRYDRETGTARYVFVLFDVDSRPVEASLVQRKPADVGRTIGARGGWYDSGHQDMGEQHKLPISAVIDRA